jgi:hypothetical protein
MAAYEMVIKRPARAAGEIVRAMNDQALTGEYVAPVRQ